jgi:hypothetical protein
LTCIALAFDVCRTGIRQISSGGSQVVVNGLPGLLGDFEPDRNARLFLPDGGAIDGVSMGRDVVDLESYDITPAQLAVDGEIEHRQVSGASLDLQLGPDRPNMLWSQRGLCPDQLAFVPGASFGGSEIRIVFVLHGHTPRLLRMTIMRRALKPQVRHQFPLRTGFGEKDRTRFAPIALHRSKSLMPGTRSEHLRLFAATFLLLPGLRRHSKSGAIGL